MLKIIKMGGASRFLHTFGNFCTACEFPCKILSDIIVKVRTHVKLCAIVHLRECHNKIIDPRTRV